MEEIERDVLKQGIGVVVNENAYSSPVSSRILRLSTRLWMHEKYNYTCNIHSYPHPPPSVFASSVARLTPPPPNEEDMRSNFQPTTPLHLYLPRSTNVPSTPPLISLSIASPSLLSSPISPQLQLPSSSPLSSTSSLPSASPLSDIDYSFVPLNELLSLPPEPTETNDGSSVSSPSPSASSVPFSSTSSLPSFFTTPQSHLHWYKHLFHI